MGGGGKGGSAPAAPDPVATAQAQGAANKDAALASLETSMIGQNNPYGQLTYTKTGTSEAGNPQYTATTTLSPDQQQLFNLQQQGSLNLGNLGIAQLGRINDAVATPFSYDGLPASPVADEAYRQQQLTAIMDRNDPFMDRERDQLITSLANQGITDPSSAAYMGAIDELNRRQNDFMLGADSQSGSEMARMFGLQQAARQQGIQEYAYQRAQPLNEYAAFMGQAAPQMPTFTNTPQYNQAPADITGPTYANYQGAMQQYGQNQQAAQGKQAGLFGLAGTAAMAGAMFL